jgi:hypothetical protein
LAGIDVFHIFAAKLHRTYVEYYWQKRRSSLATGAFPVFEIRVCCGIDRKDRIINLCEIKFSTTAYLITKAYAESLRHKIQTFKAESGTKKTVLLTFIAAHGLASNEYSMQLVHDALDMNALFE